MHVEGSCLVSFAPTSCREAVAHGLEPDAGPVAVTTVEVAAARQGCGPTAWRSRSPRCRRRLQRQRRGKLPRDILRDERETLRGQVQRIAVEQIAVRARSDAGRVREDRANEAVGECHRPGIGRDLLQQQLAVQIVNDRAVRRIAGEDRLQGSCNKPSSKRRGSPARSGSLRDFRRDRPVQRKEADRRIALGHQAVELHARRHCRPRFRPPAPASVPPACW